MNLKRQVESVCLIAFSAVMLNSTATGQYAPVWSCADQLISFGSATGLTVTDLPRPNDAAIPQAYRYNGQIATRAQHAECDVNGDLLFFVVDGNVYNGNGYRIVDAATDQPDTDCAECFYPGQEVHVYPVPGSCTQYYLISVFSSFDSDNSTQEPPGFPAALSSSNWIRVGVLDMALPNTHGAYTNAPCVVRGRLLNESELSAFDLLQDVYDAVQLVDGDLDPDPDNNGYFYEARMHDGVAGNGLVRAGSIRLINDPRGLFVAACEAAVCTFLIDEQGLRLLPPATGGFGYPTSLESTPGNWLYQIENEPSFRGEMALRQVGSELRVAYSIYGRPQVNGVDRHEPRIALWRFQLFAPNLPNPTSLGFAAVASNQTNANPKIYAPSSYPVNTTYPPLDFAGSVVDPPAIAGLEFSPNGRYLYFMKSAQGETIFDPANTFGYVDLNVPCATLQANCPAYFYPPIGGDLASKALVESQIEMNIAPNGADQAIYLLGADAVGDYWMASFTGLDDPAMGTWQQNSLDLDNLAIRAVTPAGTQYRLLNRGVAGSQQLTTLQQPVCCEDFTAMKDVSRPVPLSSPTWVPGNNPFCDATGPVYFATDLVIPTGAQVNVVNMEFRFGPEARLIIERGARFNASTCVFTGSCGRWPGIRVEGDSDLPQATGQGRLVLDNSSRVENATVGVWCARGWALPLVDPDYGGGWARLISTTFRDCIVGVAIQSYHNLVGGVEQPNLSLIIDCTFETTAAWPDQATPRAHIFLFDANGVKIRFSRFVNQVPLQFPLAQRGWGIQAFEAAFSCTGSNPALHYFRNLYAGVVGSAPDPLEIYRVDGMYFDNNQFGVVDLGSTSTVVTNNNFKTLNDPGGLGQLSIGLYLIQSEGYTVERNSFNGYSSPIPSVGVWFVGPTVTDNKIYDNVFAALVAGCVVEGRHRTFDTQTKDGLQMLCGDHGGNIIDQWILPDGMIKEQQGEAENPALAANNRFLGSPDCNTTFDPFVQAGNTQVWTTKYYYFRPPGLEADPILRPECITTVDDPQTQADVIVESTFQKYELIASISQFAFIKEDACGQGDLDAFVDPSVSFQLDQLRYKTAEYKSAYHALWTGLDKGETNDLVEFLEHEPHHPSFAMRDLLLGHHPLSDSVMLKMLEYHSKWDPWHMAQVLIDNSPLSGAIWGTVEDPDVLPVYLYNVLKQFDTGMSTKDLLENELMLRGRQKADAWTRALWAMDADTLWAGKVDTLATTLGADSTGNWLRNLYWLQLLNGRLSEAQGLEAALLARPKNEHLVDLGQRVRAAQGQWTALTPNDRFHMRTLAFGQASAAGGVAWGALLALQDLDSLPTPELPAIQKSMQRWRAHAGLERVPILLGAFPNPANELVRITFEGVVANGQLEVYDALGKQVAQVLLTDGKGFVELELSNYQEGLYLARITNNGAILGETKFTIAR